MLEEAGIFDGQYRVLHDFGDFTNGGEVTALLAEFAQQSAFGRVNAQRQLGAIVSEIRDVRQVRIGHRQRHCNGQSQSHGGGSRQAHHPKSGAHQPTEPSGAGGSGRRVLLVRGLR
ncbi:hypothetical protein D3C71_1102860 [compost metagenome]